MTDSTTLDERFRIAVTAIDAGDVAQLQRLLDAHSRLACERLEAPGEWLRDQVGGALDGFFQRPYLLWFVAEDPVRTGKLPANIATVARTIIRCAEQQCADTLREQLDYALQLVSWSWIARECDVQIKLLDVLLDAGASPQGAPENALVNGNIAAASHLVERGAPLTLATALCLERWDDVARLAESATPAEKQFALTLVALRGKAEGLRQLLVIGVDVDAVCPDLYAHATPLHHAVSSGSLESVTVLVEAGARLDARDTVHGATPLGWAQHYSGEKKGYGRIAEYLGVQAVAVASTRVGDALSSSPALHRSTPAPDRSATDAPAPPREFR
jgi:peptide-methionine (S)-S-oxide reductase